MKEWNDRYGVIDHSVSAGSVIGLHNLKGPLGSTCHSQYELVHGMNLLRRGVRWHEIILRDLQ